MSTKNPTARDLQGPETRFGYVRGFLLDRGVANYMSVFAACGVTFTGREALRLKALWNARARVTANDLPLIERMEEALENLKAA